MLITKKEKFIKKVNNVFGEYRSRKFLALLFIVLFSLMIIFPIIQLELFHNFSKSEIDLNNKFKINDPNLIASKQEHLLKIIMIFIMCLGSVMLIITIICAVYLMRDKYNGYLIFRALTWISLIGIALLVVAIAIKPTEISLRDPLALIDPADPGKGIVSIGKPNYSLSWAMLLFFIFTSISSGFTRKEYGYLKKDIYINKNENFKKNK